MSDQTGKTGDGVIEEHYCCITGCKEWGGWGFSQSKTEPVQWWCYEHYPHKEKPRR